MPGSGPTRSSPGSSWACRGAQREARSFLFRLARGAKREPQALTCRWVLRCCQTGGGRGVGCSCHVFFWRGLAGTSVGELGEEWRERARSVPNWIKNPEQSSGCIASSFPPVDEIPLWTMNWSSAKLRAVNQGKPQEGYTVQQESTG